MFVPRFSNFMGACECVSMSLLDACTVNTGAFSLPSFVSLCRPVADMVQDIREGNWLRFGPDKLKELCKLLPEESEVTTAALLSSHLFTDFILIFIQSITSINT